MSKLSVFSWKLCIWSHHKRFCTKPGNYFEDLKLTSIQLSCLQKNDSSSVLHLFWRIENWHLMTTNYPFFFFNGRSIRKKKNHQPFFQWKYDFQSCTAGTHQSAEKVSASLTTVSNNESDRKQICLSVQLEYIYWIIDEKSNNVRLLSV